MAIEVQGGVHPRFMEAVRYLHPDIAVRDFVQLMREGGDDTVVLERWEIAGAQPPAFSDVAALLPQIDAQALRLARRAAYGAQSDPLMARAFALQAAGDPAAAQAQQDWLAKRAEIQARHASG